jgi:two-component system sensor histidine kinase RegB
VDFAESEVRLAAEWTQSVVRIVITDDGPGYSPEIIDRLGEPYVTTRRVDAQPSAEHGGLGLGIFIAKTLLERSGARMRLSNRKPPEKGAVATVEWPRLEFEKKGPAEPAKSPAEPAET